jgi:hypothetical protein
MSPFDLMGFALVAFNSLVILFLNFGKAAVVIIVIISVMMTAFLVPLAVFFKAWMSLPFPVAGKTALRSPQKGQA